MDSSKEELFLMCEEARKECEDFMETCKIEDMGRGFWAPFWRSASQMSLSLTKSFLSVEMERSQPEWWNHEVIQRHLETIHRIRKYERKLRYLVHDKEIFPLPREDIRAAEPLELEVAVLGETKHSVVAARVMFLLRARKEGRSTFPSDGGLRYGGLDFSAFTVKWSLPRWYQFLCSNYTKEPWLPDWQAVVGLVGWVTYHERFLLQTIRGSCVEAGKIAADDRVVLFQTSIAYDMIGPDCKDCPVCQEEVAKTPAEGGEVPIKLHCGHMIGRDCLQTWLKSWHIDREKENPTCPLCRAQLPLLYKDIESMPWDKQLELLPSQVQLIAREWVAYARSDEALDREVDAFLLAAREEQIDGCYGVELGHMLAKLETRRLAFVQYQKTLQAVLEGMQAG